MDKEIGRGILFQFYHHTSALLNVYERFPCNFIQPFSAVRGLTLSLSPCRTKSVFRMEKNLKPFLATKYTYPGELLLFKRVIFGDVH
jgi:hypothetical protein